MGGSLGNRGVFTGRGRRRSCCFWENSLGTEIARMKADTVGEARMACAIKGMERLAEEEIGTGNGWRADMEARGPAMKEEKDETPGL